tara:strand:+ start:439 stop:573 length:135 start_codon:yes stop_codon:yes gene_type:complete
MALNIPKVAINGSKRPKIAVNRAELLLTVLKSFNATKIAPNGFK